VTASLRRGASILGALLLLATADAGETTKSSASKSPSDNEHFKFTFGTEPRRGFVRVSANTTYTQQQGYGLMSGASVQAHAHSLCGERHPFLFSMDVPEGNYDVVLTLGDSQSKSVTIVRGEARRLFLESVQVPQAKLLTRRFTVNVRYKELANGGQVHLKKDEENEFDWDHRLTFEFNGTHPCVSALQIKRNERAITVYLAGDSTVTDQRSEPWAAWGQMLPRFFVQGIAVANHAESGE